MEAREKQRVTGIGCSEEAARPGTLGRLHSENPEQVSSDADYSDLAAMPAIFPVYISPAAKCRNLFENAQ